MTENKDYCDRCPNQCPIDQVMCARGEAYAARLARGEEGPSSGPLSPGGGREKMDHSHHHGPDYPDGHEGPHGHDRPDFSDGHEKPHGHHGPDFSDSHEGPRGHDRPDFSAAFHRPGPAGGPRRPGAEAEHRPPRRPPMGPAGDFRQAPLDGPEMEDDGSLASLLLRCAHTLRHFRGRADSQTRVLHLLRARNGMSQQELLLRLGIQPGSLSELVGKLEDKGLITRQRDVTDKRRVNLYLTEEGLASLLSPARLDEADQRFSALTGEEQSTLKSLLTKLLCAQSGENRS